MKPLKVQLTCRLIMKQMMLITYMITCRLMMNHVIDIRISNTLEPQGVNNNVDSLRSALREACLEVKQLQLQLTTCNDEFVTNVISSEKKILNCKQGHHLRKLSN